MANEVVSRPEEMVEAFKALANPVRLQIMR